MSDERRKAWDEAYKSQGVLWSRSHEKWFETKVDDLILDLGCGSGKSSDHLEGTVIGVDFSIKALKLAEEKSPDFNPVCSNVVALPFRDSTFDFVRASFVLGHLTEKERKNCLCEISRILNTHGSIAVEVFSTEDGRYGKGKEIETGTIQNGKNVIHHFFEKRELEGLLSAFTIEEMGTVEWKQKIRLKKSMKRSIIRVLARKK